MGSTVDFNDSAWSEVSGRTSSEKGHLPHELASCYEREP